MKAVERWFSPRVQQDMTMVRWGAMGRPVLLYPTAGGDAEEAERFLLLDALSPLLASGRIKVYAVGSIAGRAWADKLPPRHCSWLHTASNAYLYHEVVPAIRADCHSPTSR